MTAVATPKYFLQIKKQRFDLHKSRGFNLVIQIVVENVYCQHSG